MFVGGGKRFSSNNRDPVQRKFAAVFLSRVRSFCVVYFGCSTSGYPRMVAARGVGVGTDNLLEQKGVREVTLRGQAFSAARIGRQGDNL